MKIKLTEQEAVDLLNLVENALAREYPEEDSYNSTLRSVRDQLLGHGVGDSHLLPGGLETT